MQSLNTINADQSSPTLKRAKIQRLKIGTSLPTMDFETRSKLDVQKVGAYRYAQDPSTEIMCLLYDLKDGKGVRSWHRWIKGQPLDLIAHIESGKIIEAHNAEFEFCIWNHVGRRDYKWPELMISQLRCSAAKAAVLALPRSLDKLGKALDASVLKDDAGKKLMQRMSRPKRGAVKPGDSMYVEDFNSIERLLDYCETDVRSEEACSEIMIDLTPELQKTWELTALINQRGIYCDVDLCRTAVRFADEYAGEIIEELRRITDNRILTANQHKKLKEFLMEEGLELPNTQARTIVNILQTDIESDLVRRVLEIRQLLGKSSITKYKTMINCAGPDQRIRGTLLFSGASTGRYSGRLIQPQNYPQGRIKDVHNILGALKDGDYEWFKTLFPDVFSALSASLRGMLRAAPGNELMSADFSAIEARVICWLAGDEDNLEGYRKNLDQYIPMAAEIFDLHISAIDKWKRDLGKRAVLGCGFGMGHVKFRQTCEQQGQPVDEALARKAVIAYRKKYIKVKMFWDDIDYAAKQATKNPNRTFTVGRLVWCRKNDILFCKLPSGRRLSYYDPEVREEETEWGLREQLSYMGVDKQKQWTRESSYGGKLAENVTQACAADVMIEAMFRVEAAGYPLILTVHDELIAERKKGEGSLEEFERLMSVMPKWADGLPLKVEGWVGTEYRK